MLQLLTNTHPNCMCGCTGNGVILRGTSNCTYTVTLDNNIVPASNSTSSSSISNVLFSSTSLSPGLHQVTLTAQPSASDQILSFSGGLVLSVANGTLSTPTTDTYDNQNTSISYSGTWQANKTASGIPSAQSELPFHTTSEQGASAHLNFAGRAVAVYGSTTFGHGLYTIVRVVFFRMFFLCLSTSLLRIWTGIKQYSMAHLSGSLGMHYFFIKMV